MPTISYTLSASDLTRLVDALASQWNYQAVIGGSPNPETKTQFVRRRQVAEWRRLVVQYEKQNAIKVAVDALPEPASPGIT